VLKPGVECYKKEVWERTQKTSHFLKHLKLILKQYLMKYLLSLHYKCKYGKIVGMPFPRVTVPCAKPLVEIKILFFTYKATSFVRLEMLAYSYDEGCLTYSYCTIA